MTTGVGGSSLEAELAKLKPLADRVKSIAVSEFKDRIEKAQRLLREQGLQALYLDTSTSLHYFTGISTQSHRAIARCDHSGRRRGCLSQPCLRGTEDAGIHEIRG